MASSSTTTEKDHVKVYLRLRPTDSNRKIFDVHPTDAYIEPLNETTCRTKGSTDPLHFDAIFDDSPDSQQILEQTCSEQLAQHICDGHHCSLIAYGGPQTGKTFSLFDSQHGVVSNRLMDQLFRQLQHQRFTEVTIQCSVVEFYMESVRDLLLGQPSTTMEARVHSQGYVVGCTALSCINRDDVRQVLQRGLAHRTAASDDNRRHSNKSTLVLQLTVQTVTADNNNSHASRRLSRLLVVDCAPSQYSTTASDGNTSIIQPEAMQALHACVRERADVQQQQSAISGPTLPLETRHKLPLLAQLLLHSLGSNCKTSVILCATPQQESSLSTLQFGQDCRRLINAATPNIIHEAWDDCVNVHAQANDRLEKLDFVAKQLADECLQLRSNKGNSTTTDQRLWTMIESISASSKEQRQLDFVVVASKSDHEQRMESMKLRSDLIRAEEERDKAVAKASRVKADLQSMKKQAKSLNHHYREQKLELESLRAENVSLRHRKQEVAHNLRTSLFRESEAVVFLRQFRKFYYRLLHKMAKEGSVDIKTVVRNVPGAPDLEGMVDLDRMMVESGLLEEAEIGSENAPKDYRPSRDALSRSSESVANAELHLAKETNGDVPLAGIMGVRISIVARPESGETTEARQRLFQTPSGRYIEMREKALEQELLEMSETHIEVVSLLEQERAKVIALSGSDTTSTLEATQELELLKDKLRRKEKDWQAVVLKMNELHLSAKDARDKVDNREQHVSYLETSLAESQQKHREFVAQAHASEKELRSECQTLREKIDLLEIPLWQLQDESHAPPLSSRVIVPFDAAAADNILSRAERRVSCNELDSWVDTYFKPRFEAISGAHPTATQPNESKSTPTDVARQDTDPFTSMRDANGKGIGEVHRNDIAADAPGRLPRVEPSNSAKAVAPPIGAVVKDLAKQRSLRATPRAVSFHSDSTPVVAQTRKWTAPTTPAVSVETQTNPQGTVKVAPNSILQRLQARAKAEVAISKVEGGDGVPEWMKKFKTIGAKNANEEVFETQGAAGVREFGRMPWETLKRNMGKPSAPVEMFSTSKVKWTPRVKPDSDSDTDEDPVPGTATTRPSVNDSDDDEDSGGDDDKEGDATHQPSSGGVVETRAATSDSDSSDDEQQRRAVPMSAPVTSQDDSADDSESSDDSAPKSTAPQVPTKKDGSDSDSDSDSSEELKAKKTLPLAPTKAADSDSDSESSEESKVKASAVSRPTSSVVKKTDSDSDSDSESSEESTSKGSPAPVKSVSDSEPSDSDSDSSQDEKQKKVAAPAPPNPAISKKAESDSESSEDDEVPTAVPPAPPRLQQTTDSDSEDDSSSEEESKPTKVSVHSVAKAATAKDADDSDSDEEEEEEDDGFGGWSKPASALTKGQPKLTHTNSVDSNPDSRQSPVRTLSSTLSRSVVLTKKQDGGESLASSKEPSKFVIQNGKLVRSSGAVDATDIAEAKPEKVKSAKVKSSDKKASSKPAFTIVNGKLVKSEEKKGSKTKAKGERAKKKKSKTRD